MQPVPAVVPTLNISDISKSNRRNKNCPVRVKVNPFGNFLSNRAVQVPPNPGFASRPTVKLKEKEENI